MPKAAGIIRGEKKKPSELANSDGVSTFYSLDDAVYVFCGEGIKFRFLRRIARFAKERERGFLALFYARLVERVDVEHRACVCCLKLEKEQKLTEGERVEFRNPKGV